VAWKSSKQIGAADLVHNPALSDFLARQIHQILSLRLALSDVRENGTEIVVEPLGVCPANPVNLIHDWICSHDGFASFKSPTFPAYSALHPMASLPASSVA
jgi:hypothetical protein